MSNPNKVFTKPNRNKQVREGLIGTTVVGSLLAGGVIGWNALTHPAENIKQASANISTSQYTAVNQAALDLLTTRLNTLTDGVSYSKDPSSATYQLRGIQKSKQGTTDVTDTPMFIIGAGKTGLTLKFTDTRHFTDPTLATGALLSDFYSSTDITVKNPSNPHNYTMADAYGNNSVTIAEEILNAPGPTVTEVMTSEPSPNETLVTSITPNQLIMDFTSDSNDVNGAVREVMYSGGYDAQKLTDLTLRQINGQ